MKTRNGLLRSSDVLSVEQLHEAATFTLGNIHTGRPTVAVRQLLPVIQLMPGCIRARRVHAKLQRAINELGSNQLSEARALLTEVVSELRIPPVIDRRAMEAGSIRQQ